MSRSGWDRHQILALLQATGPDQEALFRRAREMRDSVCGPAVFMRGVIELTSYCRKDCTYCAMRRSNRALPRYRISLEGAWAAARHIHQQGIAIVLLQGGEDVQCDRLLDGLISRIKQELGLFIILNVGERRRERFEAFRRLGADAYIMKFESADPELYQRATCSPLEDRMRNLAWLKDLGFVVGTGNIVGLPGQTLEQVADDLILAVQLDPDFISTAPFIPNQGTPWDAEPFGSIETALNFIAVSRLLLPHAAIPAVSALEKVGVGGQRRGLEAGANILTINFTPPPERAQYRIYSDQRFVVSLEHARDAIAGAGLRRAPGTHPARSRPATAAPAVGESALHLAVPPGRGIPILPA